MKNIMSISVVQSRVGNQNKIKAKFLSQTESEELSNCWTIRIKMLVSNGRNLLCHMADINELQAHFRYVGHTHLHRPTKPLTRTQKLRNKMRRRNRMAYKCQPSRKTVNLSLLPVRTRRQTFNRLVLVLSRFRSRFRFRFRSRARHSTRVLSSEDASVAHEAANTNEAMDSGWCWFWFRCCCCWWWLCSFSARSFEGTRAQPTIDSPHRHWDTRPVTPRCTQKKMVIKSPI